MIKIDGGSRSFVVKVEKDDSRMDIEWIEGTLALRKSKVQSDRNNDPVKENFQICWQGKVGEVFSRLSCQAGKLQSNKGPNYQGHETEKTLKRALKGRETSDKKGLVMKRRLEKGKQKWFKQSRMKIGSTLIQSGKLILKKKKPGVRNRVCMPSSCTESSEVDARKKRFWDSLREVGECSRKVVDEPNKYNPKKMGGYGPVQGMDLNDSGKVQIFVDLGLVDVRHEVDDEVLAEVVRREEEDNDRFAAISGALIMSKSSSEFNPELLVSHKYPETTTTYTERDAVIYALGVGACGRNAVEKDELKYIYHENGQQFVKVLPTFSALFSYESMQDGVLKLPGFEYDPHLLLHGQQYTEIYKPLPSNASLRHQLSVAGFHDKGKSAIAEIEIRSYEKDSGELLCMNRRVAAFLRGAGGFSKSSPPFSYTNYPKNQTTTVKIPETQPLTVFEDSTQPSQALMYMLSGDYNPLHSDPMVAKVAGSVLDHHVNLQN
ncbi:hypothetical protein Ddye_007366 [Dipteronia dyeriana]|uniref:Peroxisomal multifunctional enzyme type 2-like N-terminal domain-containing protein n=1 Tax=Dipteronia dyeriana TaxID=168575 RepID=A0AAD9XKV9_9ROSI|nr:hypothetical protein Ddye_007366 [Dipteronia dyeriana]